MQVKICGVTRVEDALLAAAAGADSIGLVRVPGPREVTLEAARAIVGAVPPSVRTVLVFRDAPLAAVVAATMATAAQAVQLHGAEPVEYLAALRLALPAVQLLRAWEIGADPDDTALLAHADALREAGVAPTAFLLDVPKGGPHPGSQRLGAAARRLAGRGWPTWCAGGLTCENVLAAVAAGPFDGVDVARGVEARPGQKDPDLVRRFIGAVRASSGRR